MSEIQPSTRSPIATALLGCVLCVSMAMTTGCEPTTPTTGSDTPPPTDTSGSPSDPGTTPSPGTDNGGQTGGTTNPGTGTGTVTLSWAPPTERADGTALANSELGGYRIVYGPTTNPTASAVRMSQQASSYTLSDLPAGSYTFAVTAFDTEGRESDLSNTVSKTVN